MQTALQGVICDGFLYMYGIRATEEEFDRDAEGGRWEREGGA